MDLIVIELRGKRVLTTAQLAEKYETDNKRISNNFNENKGRYTEGKHYFLLEGEELKRFKSESRISGIAPNLNKLYFWTEKGAWLHAKSLNTDRAWEAYELLVDEYYRIVAQQPKSQLEIMQMQIEQMIKQEREIHELKETTARIEAKQDNIAEIISLNPNEWKEKINVILNKIALARGGGDQYRQVRNQSYEFLEKRGHCRLSVRLENRKKEALANGIVPKSKIEKFKKIDIIADDPKLIEIYLAIVKEMAIKHSISIEGLGA